MVYSQIILNHKYIMNYMLLKAKAIPSLPWKTISMILVSRGISIHIHLVAFIIKFIGVCIFPEF